MRSSRGSGRRSTPHPKPDAVGIALRRALTRALPVVALVACASIVAELALQANRGVFASDECYHAYASQWLLAHRALPVEFPIFYSGLYYFYHPMLHVLGALWAGALGAQALHLLPVAIHATLLVVLASGALGSVPLAAGRWAAVLCATSVTLTAFAVQLYVDGLVALVFVLAGAMMLRVHAHGRSRDAVALGIVTAIALLTKHTGLLLPPLLIALAVTYAARGERRLASSFGLACALGVLIALPWYVRNQVLFGSAFYLAGAPDLDRGLYALSRAKFSGPPGDFLAQLPGVLGPWLGAFIAVALAVAAWRRRFGLREGLIVLALLGMAATAFVPMTSARHLTPMLAILALAGASAVHDLVRAHPRWMLAVEAALVVLVIDARWGLPDFRTAADLPGDLRVTFARVAERTPPDARILSLWTYETAYYTGRAAVWPNPWGQREHPVAMFYDTDPSLLLRHLEEARIGYILVPMRGASPRFDSANYPASFMNCLGVLVRHDTTRLVWTSGVLGLVRVAGLDRAHPLPRREPASAAPGTIH
jgi:hypothetical protein